MTNDLSVSAGVSIPNGTLNINDGTSYRIAGPAILGGTVQWDRKQVNSPDVEGDFTTHRRRTNVSETLSVYVKGSDTADLMTKIKTLTDAFSQDRFTLAINIGTSANQWDCEAADYTVELDTAHVHALYARATFNIPRKPVPVQGGY